MAARPRKNLAGADGGVVRRGRGLTAAELAAEKARGRFEKQRRPWLLRALIGASYLMLLLGVFGLGLKYSSYWPKILPGLASRVWAGYLWLLSAAGAVGILLFAMVNLFVSRGSLLWRLALVLPGGAAAAATAVWYARLSPPERRQVSKDLGSGDVVALEKHGAQLWAMIQEYQDPALRQWLRLKAQTSEWLKFTDEEIKHYYQRKREDAQRLKNRQQETPRPGEETEAVKKLLGREEAAPPQVRAAFAGKLPQEPSRPGVERVQIAALEKPPPERPGGYSIFKDAEFAEARRGYESALQTAEAALARPDRQERIAGLREAQGKFQGAQAAFNRMGSQAQKQNAPGSEVAAIRQYTASCAANSHNLEQWIAHLESPPPYDLYEDSRFKAGHAAFNTGLAHFAQGDRAPEPERKALYRAAKEDFQKARALITAVRNTAQEKNAPEEQIKNAERLLADCEHNLQAADQMAAAGASLASVAPGQRSDCPIFADPAWEAGKKWFAEGMEWYKRASTDLPSHQRDPLLRQALVRFNKADLEFTKLMKYEQQHPQEYRTVEEAFQQLMMYRYACQKSLTVPVGREPVTW